MDPLIFITRFPSEVTSGMTHTAPHWPAAMSWQPLLSVVSRVSVDKTLLSPPYQLASFDFQLK
jgi:hypothetical protein